MLFIGGTAVSQEVEENIVDMILEDRDLHDRAKAYLHSPSRLPRQAEKTVLVLQVGTQGTPALSGLQIQLHCAGFRAVIRLCTPVRCCKALKVWQVYFKR